MIYYIHAPTVGRVKIGVALNPEARLSLLRTGSPVDLVLWGAWQTPKDESFERLLHERYSEFRWRREWFDDAILRDPLMAHSQNWSVLHYQAIAKAPPYTWTEAATNEPADVIELDAFRPAIA